MYTHIWLFIGMKGSFQVAASLAKPNLIVTQDEEINSVKAESTFKTHEIKFKLNEEFDEKTPDGRKVKVGNSVIKLCARSTLISHHIYTSVFIPH